MAQFTLGKLEKRKKWTPSDQKNKLNPNLVLGGEWGNDPISIFTIIPATPIPYVVRTRKKS
jgi:hypothetical protein